MIKFEGKKLEDKNFKKNLKNQGVQFMEFQKHNSHDERRNTQTQHDFMTHATMNKLIGV